MITLYHHGTHPPPAASCMPVFRNAITGTMVQRSRCPVGDLRCARNAALPEHGGGRCRRLVRVLDRRAQRRRRGLRPAGGQRWVSALGGQRDPCGQRAGFRGAGREGLPAGQWRPDGGVQPRGERPGRLIVRHALRYRWHARVGDPHVAGARQRAFPAGERVQCAGGGERGLRAVRADGAGRCRAALHRSGAQRWKPGGGHRRFAREQHGRQHTRAGCHHRWWGHHALAERQWCGHAHGRPSGGQPLRTGVAGVSGSRGWWSGTGLCVQRHQ